MHPHVERNFDMAYTEGRCLLQHSGDTLRTKRAVNEAMKVTAVEAYLPQRLV